MKEWWIVSFISYDGERLSNLQYSTRAEAAKSYGDWVVQLAGSPAPATVTLTYQTEQEITRYEHQPAPLTDS